MGVDIKNRCCSCESILLMHLNLTLFFLGTRKPWSYEENIKIVMIANLRKNQFTLQPPNESFRIRNSSWSHVLLSTGRQIVIHFFV